MEKLDIEKLGIMFDEDAIRKNAEKINEIIDYCNKNEEDKQYIAKSLKVLALKD